MNRESQSSGSRIMTWNLKNESWSFLEINERKNLFKMEGPGSLVESLAPPFWICVSPGTVFSGCELLVQMKCKHVAKMASSNNEITARTLLLEKYVTHKGIQLPLLFVDGGGRIIRLLSFTTSGPCGFRLPSISVTSLGIFCWSGITVVELPLECAGGVGGVGVGGWEGGTHRTMADSNSSTTTNTNRSQSGTCLLGVLVLWVGFAEFWQEGTG